MINWKLRFLNKTTLVSLVTITVAFVYTVLGILDIVPAVSESSVVNSICMVVEFLAALGVIVDPTTAGVGDSKRALTYDTPKED